MSYFAFASTASCMWTCLRILLQPFWLIGRILLRQDLLFRLSSLFFLSWTHASISLVVRLSMLRAPLQRCLSGCKHRVFAWYDLCARAVLLGLWRLCRTGTFEMMRYSDPTYKNGLWLNPSFSNSRSSRVLVLWWHESCRGCEDPAGSERTCVWDFLKGCTGSWRWRNAAEKSQDHHVIPWETVRALMISHVM